MTLLLELLVRRLLALLINRRIGVAAVVLSDAVGEIAYRCRHAGYMLPRDLERAAKKEGTHDDDD